MRFRIVSIYFLLHLSSLGCLVFSQTLSWQQTNGPFDGDMRAAAVNSNGVIFAVGGDDQPGGANRGGIFRSMDNGDTWTRVSFFDFMGRTFSLTDLLTIAINNSNHIFVTAFPGFQPSGIFRSVDNGNTWTQMNNGIDDLRIRALAINDNNDIFVGHGSEGIYRSTDNGDNWSPINNSLSNDRILALSVNDNGHIFAGTFGGGIFRSVDNGDTWQTANFGLSDLDVFSIAISNAGSLFIGTNTDGVFHSLNNGDNWTPVNNGLPKTVIFNGDSVITTTALAINNNNNIFVGLSTGGLFRSLNGGQSWVAASSGLVENTGVSGMTFGQNGEAFALTGNGIYRSCDDGQNWLRVALDITNVQAVTVTDSGHVFSGTFYETPSSISGTRINDGGIYRLAPDGNNWLLGNNPPGGITSIAFTSSGTIYCGTDGKGLYRSSDNGKTWEQIDDSRPFGVFDPRISSVVVNSRDHLFAGGGPVFRSTDNGEFWISVPLQSLHAVSSLAVDSQDKLFAGSYIGGLFVSTDNGLTWVRKTGTPSGITDIKINSQQTLFVGSEGNGVYRSIDGGETLEQINDGLTNKFVTSLAISPAGDIFAGTRFEGGVFHSADNGETWHEINSGLTNKNVNALAIAEGGVLLAGTNGNGVFRNEQPITGIQSPTREADSFILMQNYPNPFNPETTGSFSLTQDSHVSLTVYNLIGQVITTLIDTRMRTGVHNVRWFGIDGNGRPVPSGLYIYKIKTKEIVAVKKMLVLR